MKTLRTIIHSNYFWIITICLYLLMLFIIYPDNKDIQDQFWTYLASFGALYWSRAFILNKEISFGVGHFDPGKHLASRCLWFVVCIFFLIISPLHLLGLW